jgi:hypothetical protein
MEIIIKTTEAAVSTTSEPADTAKAQAANEPDGASPMTSPEALSALAMGAQDAGPAPTGPPTGVVSPSPVSEPIVVTAAPGDLAAGEAPEAPLEPEPMTTEEE